VPCESVRLVWTPPTCPGLETLTVTPGSTAPVLSFTVPVNADVWTACANTGLAVPATAQATVMIDTAAFQLRVLSMAREYTLPDTVR
jgi:hypothetical protein